MLILIIEFIILSIFLIYFQNFYMVVLTLALFNIASSFFQINIYNYINEEIKVKYITRNSSKILNFSWCSIQIIYIYIYYYF